MSQTPATPGPAPAAPDLPLYMRRSGFDPAAELSAAREDDAVSQVTTPFGATAWLVTRHDDVRAVLADATRFSNASIMRELAESRGVGMDDPGLLATTAGNLLTYDPPEHTRLRRMLTPEFTMRRMRRIEPRVVEIIDEHLDAMDRSGAPADLVAEFALPVPALAICELLGVPYADRGDFQRRTGRQLDESLPVEQREQVWGESRAYMNDLVCRARRQPGEDLLGMLVREHGDDLTDAELTGIAGLLLLAGYEATSNMLGLGTLALLCHPEQLALVRDDPGQVAPAVEELMRWLSIVPSAAPKITTEDVEIAGHTIPAGETVVCALPSANRDPSLIVDPDRLDVTRGSTNHLGFGHGIHHCLGAPLARMQMRLAFPALLRRFPALQTEVPFEQIGFRSSHLFYGLRSLAVTW
jgi:cytochrome P450